MRRTVLLFALAFVLALGGCGSVEESGERIAQPHPAEPQRAELDWREFHPARVGERLVFEVGELAVTADGWSATVAVVNRTNLRFEVETGPSDYSFGLMLFATGDLKTVEEANQQGQLPAIRRARTIEPPPPRFLQPGETWQATLSAPGSLVDGSWARVVFGTFLAVGDAPDEFERVVWFTDHAYRL